ncbi:MAG: hypothetical protein Q4F95_09200 [Oscillospiraceae bacterium]|nr:hypothetical protein [Oscillospiraceae bacterium]
MKLSWNDVYDVFDCASIWSNGHDMYWYRLIWSLLEYKNLNEYKDEYDKIRVYSRAFAIIRIYTEFIDECFNETYDEFFASLEVYPYEMCEYLYNTADVHEIFTLLHKEIGTTRTFYSMYLTCIDFGEDDDEDDDIQSSDEWYSEMNYPDMDFSEDQDDDEDDEYSDYPEDEYDEDDDDESEYEDSEDYYETFEQYLLVLKNSSMTVLNEVTPEKAKGYSYLANNMRSDAE